MGDMAGYYQDQEDIDLTIWVKKDGAIVLITEMEDSHLVNTVRMLNRQAKKLNRLPARVYRRYVSLCEEVVKRGLEERI